jgi:hypothetical protein
VAHPPAIRIEGARLKKYELQPTSENLGRLGAGAIPARASAVAKMPMIILLFIDRLEQDSIGLNRK